MKRNWIILIVAAAIMAGGAGYWWTHREASGGSDYQTVTVAKGTVQDLIPATGTVEPEEAVDVGAQVAGIILAFGIDPHDVKLTVDFNTQVEKGTVLAKIDDALYQADVKQAQAQLDAAHANLAVAQATLTQDHAKLLQAQHDWERAQKLGAGEALAQSEYDSFEAIYLTAQAQVGVGEADVTQAGATIKQAEATLFRANRNLSYCIITSPVKGVVVDRRVNIGQTVVSSLNAPSLFLIATDLTKVQVWVSVNEAEIGKIHPQMPVNFEVDAFPDHIFRGVVDKVRLNATMSQNVVIYTVEIDADNPDGLLLPYMTANVKFLVSEQDNVLLVPNAALRWRPRQNEQAASSTPADNNAGGTRDGGGQGQGRGRGNKSQGGNGGEAARSRPVNVYVLDHGAPKAITVQTGITDNVFTAIVGGDLKENDEIIVGYSMNDNGDQGGTTNPFAPTFFRGGRGGGGGGGGGGRGAGGGGGGGGRRN